MIKTKMVRRPKKTHAKVPNKVRRYDALIEGKTQAQSVEFCQQVDCRCKKNSVGLTFMVDTRKAYCIGHKKGVYRCPYFNTEIYGESKKFKIDFKKHLAIQKFLADFKVKELEGICDGKFYIEKE